MKTIVSVILFGALVMMSGCATRHLPRVSEPVTVDLGRVLVHVVPTHVQFPYETRRLDVMGVAKPGEIWIIGEMKDGRIVVDWKILGHEVAHLLYSAEPRKFKDPDEK